MTAPSTEPDVRALQRRAEQAIRAARPREQIVRLLRELASVATEGSEPSCFAHRHLGEFLLEENPWSAALHLRRVLQVDGDDDAAHALMGLCQALQGNFRTAVSSYRRAVALAPSNPWYNHNLGHLLDVALGAPHDALPYLRRANRAQPLQEEVGASLAHCLGRAGLRDEGLALARSLAAKHPRHKELRALVEWLERGARPEQDGSTAALLSPRPPADPAEPPPVPAPSAQPSEHPEIEKAIAQAMSLGGYAPTHVERARALWRDYAALARPGVKGTSGVATYAAAIEYALARIDGAPLRQRDVAERHGVSVSALAARYTALRTALELVPGDARYAPRPRA